MSAAAGYFVDWDSNIRSTDDPGGGAIQADVAVSSPLSLLFTVGVSRGLANWQTFPHQKTLIAKMNKFMPLRSVSGVFVDARAI